MRVLYLRIIFTFLFIKKKRKVNIIIIDNKISRHPDGCLDI